MNYIDDRLKNAGKTLVDPLTTQLFGLLTTIALFFLLGGLFEKLVAQNVHIILCWGFRCIAHPLIIFVCYQFFKKGLETPIPAGYVGVPFFFGKTMANTVFVRGRHWSLPGKGNGFDLVDMRSQPLTVKTTIFSKDRVKMSNTTNLNFFIYDPHKAIQVKEYQKSFETTVSQSFLEMSSTKTAEEILDFERNNLVDLVIQHIQKLPVTGTLQLDDFGAEIQAHTIATEGFDFFDDRTREAFESEAREEKEKAAEIVQWKHFVNLAKELARDSNIEMSEAFLRVMAVQGKQLPDERILRLAGLSEEVTKIINRIVAQN